MRFALRHLISAFFAAALVASGVTARSANAGTFYFDWATGASRISAGDGLFAGLSAPSLGIGGALNLGVFVTFSRGDNPLELQWGLTERFNTGSDGSTSYAVASVYPVLRIQLSRLFVSAGATPFVFRSVDGGGLTSYTRAVGKTAYFAEGGLLWPIIPTFSLGAVAGYQRIGDTPSPVIDGTFLMRFYFGSFGSKGGHNPNEFKGWRYPFGLIR